MTQPRTTRRVIAAALSVGALLATAACSSGTAASPAASGSASAATGANWDETGPITYAQGKDTSGNLKAQIDQWNKENPNEQVTFRELSDNADEQRSEMIKRAQAKSGEFTVMSVDVVWTSEFAANGWLTELPADKFNTTGFLKAAVDSATYFNKLYAMPSSSDGALLYYRKDLLDKAGVQAPTTWDEMQQACDKVLPGQSGMSCYGGQFQKYEGLTCNFAEAVNSAGGAILGEDGKPTVNSAEAVAGLTWMQNGFKSGMIPKEAITWKEEESRQAFQTGKILFLRNWPYVYNLASAKDSKVAGKFDVAPIPGKTGPGVSTLGGHSYGISAFAKNKGTAMKWINWMLRPENQKDQLLKASSAPVLESLYSDPELVAKFGYLPTLLKSIQNAKPRPKAVAYGDVTLAIQDAAYAPLNDVRKSPQTALDDLQAKLTTLIK
ncbi:ABC transporter substrate-binding protein [Micropruina glycogenica]|uniref:Multiple sugar transport system substrate-binding protein n=1 Tax=Micropruina glycogenica TaxID=75385 RepID=A0A2N9JDH1_9ACTN|nr:ABC transporter substrate-binding protein [Micropruina glycogenica]SPD85515.1 Multiple sugar transport system substrate-binding protein [Micropruina glycogenica]